MQVSELSRHEKETFFDRDVISLLNILNVETGKVMELCRFDYLIEAPSFLSDNEIIYNSKGKIYRYNVKAGEAFVVDTGYCEHCNNDHVISSDGSRIAVSHMTEEDWLSRIYVIDLCGRKPPQLITPLAPSYLHGWSPDGRELAYCAERNEEYNIYTISVDGGVEKQLTNTKGLDDGPEYSCDGKYIFFNSVRNGLMDCYRMDADGENIVRLTDNGRNNWFPHISPDLEKVVYISYRAADVAAGDHPANKNVQIRRVNPDGTNDEKIISLFGGQGTLNVNSWRANSREVAFVSYIAT